MVARSTSPGVVVYLPCKQHARGHERATHAQIAAKLAALIGFDPSGKPTGGRPTYIVPSDTLLRAEAKCLGIRTERDLFGGVVPHGYVATKVITHPLAVPVSGAPQSWSADFCRRVAGIVLKGVSAFTHEAAYAAGLGLLELGAVRVKPALEAGGRGQNVAEDAAALHAALAALDPTEMSLHGVVLEENLDDVITVSVGQVRVGELSASYFGTQSLTPDNCNRLVYGGSALTVVRGGFDALLRLSVPDDVRLAVAQARTFDAAAPACFPGFIASRRNYDILQGVDRHGRRRSGVLEQSWRIGGASSAEVVALEAFKADPSLEVVRASSVEAYGCAGPLPDCATVFFHGTDPDVGLITKYAMVQPHAG